MSMLQLVIASALGFAVAQAGMYGLRSVAGWMHRGDAAARKDGPAKAESGHHFIGTFVRYAAPVGASVAVITLGVWAVGDYLAGKSAHNALTASTTDPAADAAPVVDDPASAAIPPAAVAAADPEPEAVDPFADADYKVPVRKHRSGTNATLEDALLQRSENKARTELLKGLQLHAQRSQYDCEATDRAQKYLKAGLDVWGFSQWQAKYYPTASYKGATLEQCREIKNMIDPSTLDLRSTVAQDKRP